MPYYEPHRTVRARIIDLEIMKLELRKNSHSRTPLARGEVRTIERRRKSPHQAF